MESRVSQTLSVGKQNSIKHLYHQIQFIIWASKVGNEIELQQQGTKS